LAQIVSAVAIVRGKSLDTFDRVAIESISFRSRFRLLRSAAF
jgi:hypothetical protein